MAIIVMDCPHCPSNRVAFYLMSIGMRSGDASGTAHAVCSICAKPVGFWIKQGPRPSSVLIHNLANFSGVITNANWEIEDYWPKRQESKAPLSVPPAIARNFVQAEEAARNGHREAAGMAYRRVLELTMKDKYPTGTGTLAKRIRDYAAAGGLTDAVRDWADTVRELGNEAAHDDAEPSEADIADLASFTRVLLEYLYTMPAKVAARSASPPPTPPAGDP